MAFSTHTSPPRLLLHHPEGAASWGSPCHGLTPSTALVTKDKAPSAHPGWHGGVGLFTRAWCPPETPARSCRPTQSPVTGWLLTCLQVLGPFEQGGSTTQGLALVNTVFEHLPISLSPPKHGWLKKSRTFSALSHPGRNQGPRLSKGTKPL